MLHILIDFKKGQELVSTCEVSNALVRPIDTVYDWYLMGTFNENNIFDFMEIRLAAQSKLDYFN